MWRGFKTWITKLRQALKFTGAPLGLPQNNPMSNVKSEFLRLRLKRRHPVLIYVHEPDGTVTSFTVDPDKNYIFSAYGLVEDSRAGHAPAWTVWRDVYSMICRDDHCVDWSNIPRSVLDGHSTIEMKKAYKTYAQNVIWYGDTLSLGTTPKFTWQMPQRKRNKRLPAGWRVFEGGRA